MQQLPLIDLIVLVLYLAGMVALGWRFNRANPQHSQQAARLETEAQ